MDAVISSFDTYRKFLAEIFGTFVVVFVGCGSCVKGWEEGDAPTVVHISLAFGLAVCTAIHATGHISGGHVNPCVSLAMMLTGNLNFYQTFIYMMGQCIGAFTGVLALFVLVPNAEQHEFGLASVDKQLTEVQGFYVEAFLTSCLVFAVCAATDKKNHLCRGSPAIPVGLVVTACHLFGIRYTGCAINPFRALAPAVFTQKFQMHWVYWFGPIAGSVTGAIVYQILNNTLLDKLRCAPRYPRIRPSRYDDDAPKTSWK